MGVPPNHPFIVGFLIINHPFWDTSMEKPICRWPQLVFQFGKLASLELPGQGKVLSFLMAQPLKVAMGGGRLQHWAMDVIFKGCPMFKEEMWMIVNNKILFFSGKSRFLWLWMIVQHFFQENVFFSSSKCFFSWKEYTCFYYCGLSGVEQIWKVSSLKDRGGRPRYSHGRAGSARHIRWLGLSSLELWISIFPIKRGASWSYELNFPNRLRQYITSKQLIVPLMTVIFHEHNALYIIHLWAGTPEFRRSAEKKASWHLQYIDDRWDDPPSISNFFRRNPERLRPGNVLSSCGSSKSARRSPSSGPIARCRRPDEFDESMVIWAGHGAVMWGKQCQF